MKISIKNLGAGIAWYIYWFVLVLLDVGETIPATTVVWYDPLWVPLIMVAFPFWLGMGVYKSGR